MTYFKKITQSPEALGAFLASLPIVAGPWDAEFSRNFCDGCDLADCDGGSGCPHEDKRNNPAWWLGLEVKENEHEQMG